MMKHTYLVQGMRCHKCVKTIEELLSKVPNVSDVKVAFPSKMASIQMSGHLTLTQFNHALKDTEYRLVNKNMAMPEVSNKTKLSFKDFIPLMVAFIIIFAYTAIMLLSHGSWNGLYAMRHFEGAFFVIFGILKLLNWKGFVEAYRSYDLVAKHSQIYAYAYPLIELGLGLAYLMAFQLLLTNIITLIIMIIGTIGVAKALINKKQIVCACMGAVFKIPMTTVTLIEDLLMAIMALLMIFLM